MFRQFLTKLGEQTSLAIFLRQLAEIGFRKQRDAITRFLLPLPPGGKVLDFGCGTGEFAPLFPKEAYEGIDIDPANIAYAERHYPEHHFSIGDATRLTFPDASFDAILVAGVFHHLTDEQCAKAVSEMRRVLKPGGVALVMEDTQTKRVVSRLMQAADQGAFIRMGTEWDAMFGKVFNIKHRWQFKSGVCFYTGFVLT